MKGGHDLGGKTGHGPVNAEAESEEPVFHSEWERRVFALTLASGMLGKWNIDESRHARERQPADRYLDNSYYENWLEGLESLLQEKQLLSGVESADSSSLRVPDVEVVAKILSSGGPSDVSTGTQASFKPGDTVRVRNMDVEGHTRAPEYVHGKTGIVREHIGHHIFPDLNSQTEGRTRNDPVPAAHLYSVCFSAQELWPEGGRDSMNSEVRIDLWEPYLEAAI